TLPETFHDLVNGAIGIVVLGSMFNHGLGGFFSCLMQQLRGALSDLAKVLFCSATKIPSFKFCLFCLMLSKKLRSAIRQEWIFPKNKQTAVKNIVWFFA